MSDTTPPTPAAGDVEYGPLGPGHAPAKDPLKGLNGVMAGTLVMESISLLLVLTVIGRLDSGAYWTPANWLFVTAIGVVMFVWAFFQRTRVNLVVNIALQVVALVGAFFVHYSMVIMVLVFIAVWAFILYLRSNLIARMKRGLLTTQHT
ncbi:DUF4233 domain-containing protein [Corynebacterium sp. 13CS0277]|uniref:DUF4233 domain-containing protein n=1 Tax=Corynebacterium sp. 13CS0277 TaxID=2071994 RepID=UPI000D03D674|nr:DUF4233 domain-containing protein [Corynebacterium sp. 13CS0277]PRQ11693.1 DUF4233 domain-containing protein [Corynebacterium sp. 13CS0277]